MPHIANHWRMHFGPTMPNTIRHLGGVGALCISELQCIPLKPQTKDFRNVVEGGRAMMYAQQLTQGRFLYAIIIYGLTGGHQKSASACGTDDICAAAVAELLLLPEGPAIIMTEWGHL